MDVTTMGLDVAKQVFQVHGVDTYGKVVVRKQLRRKEVVEYFTKLPSCEIGMEAGSSSHDWARRLQGLGHRVKLIYLRQSRSFVYEPPKAVSVLLKQLELIEPNVLLFLVPDIRPHLLFVRVGNR